MIITRPPFVSSMAVNRFHQLRSQAPAPPAQTRNHLEIGLVFDSDARHSKAAREYLPEIWQLERWDRRPPGDTSPRFQYPIPSLTQGDSRRPQPRPDRKPFST